jgi:ornithine decarboxylase
MRQRRTKTQKKRVPTVEGAVHELLHGLGQPTPLVIAEQEALDTAIGYFQRYLPSVELFYAVKANPEECIVRHFAQSHGVGLDIASEAELATASRLGIKGSSLLVSNPVKDWGTIRRMLAMRCRGFAVDNFSEIEKVARLPRAADYVPEVFVRIRTESDGVQIDLNDKFGCPARDAAQLLLASREAGFNPCGLTFHVGTQSYLAENYRTGFEHCFAVAEEALSRYGIKVTQINMGGGYCDAEVARLHHTTVPRLLSEINEHVLKANHLGFTVLAEPGRALVANSATLVTEVIGATDRGGLRFLYIDDGVYGVLSGQMFDHRKYEFKVLRRSPSRPALTSNLVTTRVCGRTCDSIDIISGDHQLPANLGVGDILMVSNVGAYGSATCSLFNGFTPAKTVLWSRNGGIQQLDESAAFGFGDSFAHLGKAAAGE